MNKKAGVFLVFLVLLLAAAIVSYFLIKPNQQIIITENSKSSLNYDGVVELGNGFEGNKFLWEHIPLTYRINKASCGEFETNRIIEAFKEVQLAFGKTDFFKLVEAKSDIEINCSFIKDCYKKDVQSEKSFFGSTTSVSETICPYQRGVAEFSYYNKTIKSSTITFYGLSGFLETDGKGPSGFLVGSCNNLNAEKHEILHVLGYGHVDDPDSIMYKSEDGAGFEIKTPDECNNSEKKIDQWISDDFKKDYP